MKLLKNKQRYRAVFKVIWNTYDGAFSRKKLMVFCRKLFSQKTEATNVRHNLKYASETI